MNTKEKLLNQTVKFYHEYNEQVAQGIGDSCYEFEIMKSFLKKVMDENAGLSDDDIDELLQELTQEPYYIKKEALSILKQNWQDAILQLAEEE